MEHLHRLSRTDPTRRSVQFVNGMAIGMNKHSLRGTVQSVNGVMFSMGQYARDRSQLILGVDRDKRTPARIFLLPEVPGLRANLPLMSRAWRRHSKGLMMMESRSKVFTWIGLVHLRAGLP